ncbi:hypothetical protein JW766_01175 [Candidatus Dojkabacteria bacterium]|nr:hypothetical protein [Candidatus Dojkabacteria bacterium]
MRILHNLKRSIVRGSLVYIIILIASISIGAMNIVYAKTDAIWGCDDGYEHTDVSGNDDCCAESRGTKRSAIAEKIKEMNPGECSDDDVSEARTYFYKNDRACTYGLYCTAAGGAVKETLDNSDIADILKDDFLTCAGTNKCMAGCQWGANDCCPGTGFIWPWVNSCFSQGESMRITDVPTCPAPAGAEWWCGSSGWQDSDPTPPGPSPGPGGSELPSTLTCEEVCRGEDGEMNEACCLCVCSWKGENPTCACSADGGEASVCNVEMADGNIWTELGCINSSEKGIIIAVMRIFVGVVTALAVVRFIQAGIMLNTDDPEKIKEGKSIAVSAIAAVIFGAMIPILLNFIGLDILGIGEIFL